MYVCVSAIVWDPEPRGLVLVLLSAHVERFSGLPYQDFLFRSATRLDAHILLYEEKKLICMVTGETE